MEIIIVAMIWILAIIFAIAWFLFLKRKAISVQRIRKIKGRPVLLADYAAYPTRLKGSTRPFGKLFLTKEKVIFDSEKSIVFGKFMVEFSLNSIDSISAKGRKYLIFELRDGRRHKFQLTLTSVKDWKEKVKNQVSIT